jgi:hypothetical protein
MVVKSIGIGQRRQQRRGLELDLISSTAKKLISPKKNRSNGQLPHSPVRSLRDDGLW